MGMVLLACAPAPLWGSDGWLEWDWTPLQLGVLPTRYLQLVSSYSDVYGVAVGGVLMQRQSAALSVALYNLARFNYLVELGVISPSSRNYALNAGLYADAEKANFGVLVGGGTYTWTNYGVNVGGFVEGTMVNYGVTVGGYVRQALNCGLNVGLASCVCINRSLSVGGYNVVGTSGLFCWDFNPHDLEATNGVQIGLFNVGCGLQLGLLNYNPRGLIKWMPGFNFSPGW